MISFASAVFYGQLIRCFFCQLLLQVFLCGRKHQLDSVELIDLAGSWVIVDGDDVGERILMTQFLDDAFADYMIWKTAKGLRADNIVDAGVDKLQHFSSEEPSLSGLVPKGHDPSVSYTHLTLPTKRIV